MQRNENIVCRAALIAFILLLLPMTVLSFYNVPSADDYTFGTAMYQWVQENGFHILGMIRCAIQNMVWYYFNWQGRYSESFIASFMPDIFGLYWLSALVILFALISAVTYFVYIMVRYFAGKEKFWISVLLAVFACIAITQKIPSAVEGFYWFDGAQAYMLHHAFYIWMCAFCIQYFFLRERRFQIACIVIISILTILAAGGNNVTSFTSILTYVVFVAISLLIKKKRLLIFPFAISIIGFMISFLSPGTVIRGGGSSNYTSILGTIIKCFRWTLRQYILEWTSADILIMLLVLTPFLSKIIINIIKQYKFKFRFPVLLVLGSICFLAAMSSPAFYILGESGPLRMRNIIYVNYILLLILNYTYFLGWLAMSRKNINLLYRIADVYTMITPKYGVLIILGSIFWLSIGTVENYGTSFEAAKELVSGQAARYHQEYMERKKMYEDEILEEVEVEPYSVTPQLLFFDDITDDPQNWKNLGVSNFYGKKTVILSEYVSYISYD